jgi:hypothetical protein
MVIFVLYLMYKDKITNPCILQMREERRNKIRSQAYQNDDGSPLLQLFQAPFVGPDAFDQRDGERVKLVRLVSLVDDGQRHPEPEVLQVANFFG